MYPEYTHIWITLDTCMDIWIHVSIYMCMYTYIKSKLSVYVYTERERNFQSVNFGKIFYNTKA